MTGLESHDRLDNATVVDFLTSTAGALAETGILSHKDTDSLRVALTAIGGDPALRDQPLLIALERQRADFLTMLDARYSRTGLCLNLLSYSLRVPLQETLRQISEFGRAVLRKSELLFNRPFRLYRNSVWDAQVLFPTVLMDFAESLRQTADEVHHATLALSIMNGQAGSSDETREDVIDLAVARVLGFTSVERPIFLGSREHKAKRQVARCLEDLAKDAAALADQLVLNSGAAEAYGAALGCDALAAECLRLAHLELPYGGGLVAWEIRRRAILEALERINQALAVLSRNLLGQITKDTRPAAPAIAMSALRHVSFDLMVTGVAPQRAYDAASALKAYIEKEQINASEILPGELARIHPALTQNSLAILAAIEKDQTFMARSADEKTRTLTRAQSLSVAFTRLIDLVSARTSTIIAVCVVFLGMNACGLKTKLVAEITEHRPEVPFSESTKTRPLTPAAASTTTKDSSHERDNSPR